MGLLCKFVCDRCGLTEETKRDNYFGTIKQYDAETYLCQKCRDGLNKAIRDYIHKTGSYSENEKEGE